MSRILYVATVVKTHIMEFHLPYLKMLKENGWTTAVAAKNDYDNPEECRIPDCDEYFNIPFERNPLKPGNIKAYKELKKVIDAGNYDIIHCHTPVGAMLARLAARKARKKGTEVIYTAHGFHFYKGAPLLNWLLYYPVEKFLARYTDVLVTINREDYERAKKFKAAHVEYIPGIGIDINKFGTNPGNRSEKRKEFNISDDEFVFLSVGELNKNKNHRVAIEALPSLENCRYIICGSGPLADEYRQLAEDLGVSDKLILAGYRTDITEFYHMADAFVFPSYREGLPVSLMEAMAAELPCIAARNRGTNDLLSGSELLFEPSDQEEVRRLMKKVMNEDCTSEIRRNTETLKTFSLDHTLQKMKEIYSEYGRK